MIPGKASLIDSGFLSKQAEPPLIDKGYFKHLAGGNNGHVWTRSVLTPKGIEWLRSMFWVWELRKF